MAETVSSPAADEVKPYKIHIPSKHLDLTRQKLELTRLPHEPSHASDSNIWAPKRIIEPLIDYWLESYSWRTTESLLNTNSHLPQFRTAITPQNHHAPIRIHFIHARSGTPGAVPLLQHFHVIIPSLPGTAFSDPLPPSSSPDPNPNPVTTTAALLDALMHRLGYTAYLASATAPGVCASTTTPTNATTSGGGASSSSGGGGGAGRVGERIARRLATAHAASCLGVHLVCPLLRAPRWRRGVRGWGRWVAARVLRGGSGGGGGGKGVGYERGDLEAWGRVAEPDTLAYALCDSPVGMLAFVLRGLRLAAGGGKAVFARDELITLTSLMWLPGPEGMLRFWAACGRHREEEKSVRRPKPRVAITVFVGAGGSRKGKQPATATATAVVEGPEETGLWPTVEEVAARKESYCPPAWANALFDVVHIQRVPGPSSGLVAWEQPDVILAGVRGLAKAVLAKDARLVPVVPSTGLAAGHADTGNQAAGAPLERPKPAGSVEAIPMADGAAARDDHKGKGKDTELLIPPVVGLSIEDGSPGTLVNTPPLERL
ncbi:hypothetical protein B0I37DRAFT_429020 [Chaetomium sp. MPI-CAGE-AT-0009]|nr:hypothetical protein B0I37DRAFT_429020 [Chaetomium sp. MPI-CAGE-AT-0009]